MRIALTILVGVHATIHLFGFLKAFGLSEFNAITQPIPKHFGIIWLLTFIMFATCTLLLSIQSRHWWIFGMVGVILSQLLIINYWGDARFGTIANLAILAATILAYSAFSFKKKVSDEVATMLDNSSTLERPISSDQVISDLPPIVQKWLLKSGAIGQEVIYNIYLEQDLEMMMKPDQKEWMNGKARQYFTIEPPAFNWSVSLKLNPLLNAVGRDRFENGQGEMTIKLYSIFSIAHVKNDERVNQATLQRYLAETVWFPSAALSPHVTWETIDDHSARATMAYNGTKGSGIFHFDETGTFKQFMAMRYKDAADTVPLEWTITAIKTETRNGIEIPVESKADWKLDNGSWTWLRLKVTDIKYNVQKTDHTGL